MKQHDAYIDSVMRSVDALSTRFVRLPAIESLPDCCFVEDVVVSVARGTVVFTNPAAPTRQAEVGSVRDALMPILNGFGATIHHIGAFATCDGGDVLVAGRAVFVGESERTNAAGHDAWRNIAKSAGLQAFSVPVGASALHLKSLVTFLGADIGFLAANTDDGRSAMSSILSRYGQAPVFFVDPPIVSANAVRTSPHSVIVSPTADFAFLRATHPSVRFLSIDMSELNKADGALSCCSVLIEI